MQGGRPIVHAPFEADPRTLSTKLRDRNNTHKSPSLCKDQARRGAADGVLL
jgi:hypothetical protein